VPKTWYVHCHRWALHRGRPRRTLPQGKGTFFVGLGRHKYTVDYCYKRYLFVRERVTDGNCSNPLKYYTNWRLPSMKKRVAKGAINGDQKHLAPVETNLFSQLMPLVEHMAVRRYDDGDPREPGWITIKTQGAAWVVQVKDPDGGVSFSAIGQSLDNALETAALLLACDEAPWEPDRFLMQSKADRKKK